jgi:Protein of unknown function (DUF3800)
MATYRLYVDEVGNDDLSHVQDDEHRYLSLTGIAMSSDHARDRATPRLNAFKADIFQHDPDEKIIFHRKHIMNRRGIFHKLIDEKLRARFDAGLVQYLAETEYAAITVVIDKLGMLNQKHWEEKHPYHYLMELMVEKFVQWLERKKGVGDIMPEMRRGRKDTALQRAYNHVRLWGTNFVDPGRIKSRP